MKIANELDVSNFYVEQWTPATFFPMENQYFLGELDATELPWLQAELPLASLREEWNQLYEEIHGLFRNREKQTIPVLMARASAVFIRLLFWSNQQPVQLKFLLERIETLEIKPANIGDRLGFIISNPLIHHSIVQLSELMLEQQKKYYKYLAMKKRATNK
ncbi:hypothetical protein OEV98_08905 [Caldibacillus lycopersici]|uniref:YpoC-like domain-containing protein n=1 Tax=Perspicuibacillus lycopersici TaxID=1325689 RepID=A0AAE3LT96_9BACI|nr:hypothetical protein [Perspicuibacillus lycopersici]MCU9613678.1 hypothetical protein [Perspicuibacillus lycopersici]